MFCFLNLKIENVGGELYSKFEFQITLQMHFSPTTSESIFSPNNQSFSPLSARSLTETISNAWSDPSEQTVQDSSLNDEHQPRSKRTKIIVVGIITGLSLVVIVLIIALVVSLRSTNTTQTGMSTGNVIPYFSKKKNFLICSIERISM